MYARTCACWCGWTTEHTSEKTKLVENKKTGQGDDDKEEDESKREGEPWWWQEETPQPWISFWIPQGTLVGSHTVVRSETPKNGNTWTDALRQISSHSCPHMLKLVPSQWWCHYHQPECQEDVATLSKIFVLYLQLKLKAPSARFVTPSGDTVYCTQCWVITIFWRPAGSSQ